MNDARVIRMKKLDYLDFYAIRSILLFISWQMQNSHLNFSHIRPQSVDSLDGGSTDAFTGMEIIDCPPVLDR